MIKTIDFTNEAKDSIIVEQDALFFRLYEEQRHFDGWRLLFTDEPYIEHKPPRDLEAEITTLTERVKLLERGIR